MEARSDLERAAGRGDGTAPTCPPDLRDAVELIGRRWAGAIVWVLADQPRFFAEIAHAVPGMSDRLLSRRLRELEAEGLVERAVHSGSPARVSYSLTEKGTALEPALRELRSWARRWSGVDATAPEDGAPERVRVASRQPRRRSSSS